MNVKVGFLSKRSMCLKSVQDSGPTRLPNNRYPKIPVDFLSNLIGLTNGNSNMLSTFLGWESDEEFGRSARVGKIGPNALERFTDYIKILRFGSDRDARHTRTHRHTFNR